MKNIKSIDILVSSSCQLDQDVKDKAVDPKLDNGMIELLLYLTAIGTNIIFSICIYAYY